MNKNFKVFQIHGISGLLFVGIVLACLFCGFVLFPIWVIMTGWNETIGGIYSGPVINYYQASLLWIFIAICFYLFLKNSIKIKIYKSDDIDDEEVTNIIEKEIIEEERKNDS